MGKKLVILLVMIIVVVLPVGILAADFVLSISDLSKEKIDSFNYVTPGTPNVDLAADNSSFTFEIDITVVTPEVGFIPKSIEITLQICEGETSVGDKTSLEIAFGSTIEETIGPETITLSNTQKQTISDGGSIKFSLQATATAKMFGVELPLTFHADWWWRNIFCVPGQTVDVNG